LRKQTDAAFEKARHSMQKVLDMQAAMEDAENETADELVDKFTVLRIAPVLEDPIIKALEAQLRKLGVR